MEKNYVAVGMIGLGDHGTDKVIPALAQVPNAKIIATCDMVAARSQSACRNYGANNYYLDYREMIEREQLDAVVVAVGPQMHYEVACYALGRGLSVFVEKPPAVSSEQIKQMVKLADESSAITGVGLNFRYTTPIRMIKQILEKDPGDYPVWIAVKHVSAKPRGEPAWPSTTFERSFLLMQVIHALDTLIFFGGPVVETSAVAHKGETGVLLSCNFRFANKAIGNLVTGCTGPNFSNSLEMETHKGKVFRLDHLWNLSYGEINNPIKLVDSKRWEYAWRPSPTESGYKRTGYSTELTEFFECVETHRRFSPSFNDVVQHYELIDLLDKELTKY